MNARRVVTAALAWAVASWALGAFTPVAAETQRELVAEAVAQAFTIRASVDYGGAAKLPFFFGSFADANLTNPPAGADGQASWYNLGIAETAVFTPPAPDPKACTPEEQQRRTNQAVTDVSDWVTTVAIPKLLDEHGVAVVPLPTLPCTERLAGFSQSRYPATQTIAGSSSDTLLWSALCKAGACPVSDALAPATEGAFDGGRFTATATDTPSQRSDALMTGIHIPGVLDIGAARALAVAGLVGERLVTEAVWTGSDVCVAPGDEGCALSIRSIRQIAHIERDAAGKVVKNEARTVIAGVDGGGQAAEVTAADLGPGLPPVALGDNLFIRAVSNTEGCGEPGAPSVADAGGLEIVGQGSGGPSVTLPVPILGSASGGGVLIGGACASGRMQAVTFELPQPSAPGTIDIPGTAIVTPPGPGGPAGSVLTGPVMSGPRVVRKDSFRYVLRRAPAWRTAPYWASVLGALALAVALAYLFRRSRPVAPVAAAVDRFARQFVRG